MHGLARFCGLVLGQLGVERHALVVHDWGALALIDAIARPHEVERLVVINAVPLLPGYRWHWLARLWRTRGVGPLTNAMVTRRGIKLLSRFGPGEDPPLPDRFAERVADAWRGASSAAILRLYRSADPPALAAAGHGLAGLTCPSLVVWGARDPYVPPRFGRVYAQRLPHAELLEFPDAGHFPWIERPELVDRVVGFLDA
jgi:pimeloyl-ACP methyl ester carboxylesterase